MKIIGGWDIHGSMGCFVRKGLRVCFGICAGIPLFGDVTPVRDITEDDDG